MWTIIKFQKKKLGDLKKDLSKNLGSCPKIYLPKLNLQKNKNNKTSNLESLLLGDYLFCHHNKFNINGMINSLKYCRGLKYFLTGFLFSQIEIAQFIKHCKTHEDNKGYIKQSFFDFERKQNFKFISGPFREVIFNIIQENQNKLKILAKNIEVTVSKKKDYLFRPV